MRGCTSSSNIAILCRFRPSAGEITNVFEGPARFEGGWKLYQKTILGIREIAYGSFPIHYKKLFAFKGVLA